MESLTSGHLITIKGSDMAVARAVEPIRSLEDIRSIKQMLLTKPRDHLLFVIVLTAAFG